MVKRKTFVSRYRGIQNIPVYHRETVDNLKIFRYECIRKILIIWNMFFSF